MKKHENPAEANVRRDFFCGGGFFYAVFPRAALWREKSQAGKSPPENVKDQSYQFLKLRNKFCSPSKTSVRVG